MTTRKKTQPSKRGRPTPARAARPTAAKPSARKAESAKRQAQQVAPISENESESKHRHGARRAPSKAAKDAKGRRESVQEDALPLDVLGEIEEIVADPNLLLDVKPSIEGEGEDSLGESVDEASAPGDNSGGDFENPGNSSVGDREDNACGREEGESLGHSESEVAKLSASSDNSDSQNDDWDSGQASIESTSADSIALDGSADTEQAGAAVYELSDFLRPQREDSPIVDATGPDTPEAIIGDELGSDTSANDTESFLKCALEAVMFASDKPLTVKDIAKALQLDRRRAQEILTLLRSDYENRGFRIEEVADGFAFRSHPKIAEYVRAFLEQKPVKLSRAQLETLAIVAYRQPITRPETDDIRGVDCGPVLKGLLERDLIRVIGKKDEPGRPMLYGTTPAFLELFGLKSLEELPTLKEFTELTDESRRQFENEMGEEAPVGLADFGLSNQDEPPPDAEESAVPDASPASAEPDFDQPSIAESDDATVSEPDHSDGAPAESDEDDSDEDEDDSDEDDSDDDDSGSS